MLKHCQSSSVRLQRRYNANQADSVSLNSTLTIRSNGESSDSSLNSSFNTNEQQQSLLNNKNNNNLHHQNELFHMRNALFVERAVYNAAAPHTLSTAVYGGGSSFPDHPISLSSRASSYCSLADTVVGPKTAVKVFASCLRPDIEYKTLSVGQTTTARDVIWQLLSKYRMKHRDPKLFFLTMEVVIQKPGRDGLTKKTIVLEDEAKPAELKNCNPWGECRFTLQMRKGGLVKVYDSVLMEESQYKCLLISEETSVEDVIKLLLYCYGLEKIERADRYCMYEQCSSQRYQRKLAADDKPLAIQGLWPGPTPFSFVLRRSLLRIEDSSMVWSKQPLNQQRQAAAVVESLSSHPLSQHSHGHHQEPRWPAKSEWSTQTEDRLVLNINEDNINNSSGGSRVRHTAVTRPTFYHQQVAVTASKQQSRLYGKFPDCSRILREEVEEGEEEAQGEAAKADSWPELDKDSGEEHVSSCGEEHVSSSGEEMDTSLSSNDSPIPPLTSTPLCLQSRPIAARVGDGVVGPILPRYKPSMSFLFPSPDYDSFPSKCVPSRPYSSQSASSLSTSLAPSLPPKPASLASLFFKAPNEASSSCSGPGPRVYENYFYI